MERSDNSRSEDTGQLSNYQLSELATNPYISPEYGKQLDSELERRREAGDFDMEKDLDDAIHEHESEMREQVRSNMRKRNRQLGANTIANANFEQEQFEDKNLRDEARRRENSGHASKSVNTNTYFNDFRQGSRTSRGIARSEGFRIPTEEVIGRTIEKAEAQLDEHFLDYYTEGAIEALSNGDFRIDPRGFITSSFMNSEKQKFDHQLVEERRPEFWESVRYDVIDEKVREWSSLESVREAEREAIMEAVRRGAYVEKTGMHEAKLHTTLPLSEKQLDDFAQNYGVDFSSPEVRKASYEGFLSIIDTIKDDGRLLKDGIKALDWYYDKFDYANNLDDFLDAAYGYADSAGARGRTCLNAYLAIRSEYQKYVTEKHSDEQHAENIENIESNIQPIPVDSEEEVKKMFADFGLAPEDLEEYAQREMRLIEGEILPAEGRKELAEEERETSRERDHYPRSYARQKMLSLYLTYHIIKNTVDPEAQIIRTFRKTDDVEDSDGHAVTIGSDRYALIRFGCINNRGEEENHVIAEGNSPEAATYVWHGEGDNWIDALVEQYKMQARRNPNVRAVFHNHSQSAIDHMALIMAELGFDLYELARQTDRRRKEEAASVETA